MDAQIFYGLFHGVEWKLIVARERGQSCEHDVFGVDFEEVAKSGAILAAPEAVGPKRHEASRNPLRDALGEHLHVVGGGNEWAGCVFQSLRHVWNFGCLSRVQHVPAFGVVGITIELLVAGDAPHIRADAIFFFENLLGLEHFKHDRAAAEELSPQLGVLFLRRPEAVQAFEDAIASVGAIGHLGHWKRLVGDGEVVEDGLAVDVHALNTVFDDDRDLVSKCRIVGEAVGNGERVDVGVAVLVLQAFPGERGPSSGAADEESARAHIGCGPDQVTDALESKHRVINEEGDRVDAVVRVRGACRDERAHRAGFGDAFFEDLAVFRFLVVEERIHVDWLIELTDAGVNADLTEERFHAEGASFVGNDGNDELADFGVAQKLGEQADEDHGGGDFAAVGAFVELFEVRVRNALQRRRAHFALGHVSAELLAAFLHVLDFGTVVGRTIERSVVQFVVGNGDAEARTEHAQLFVVEFFLLVSDVLAFTRFAHAVALDRLCQNDGWLAVMFDGCLVRGVDLDGIVATEAHPCELLVGEMFDHLQQPRISTEEVLAEVRAAFDEVLLVLAVADLAHAPDQQSVAIALNERVPIAAPDDLNDVPARAAKDGFEFLNDFSVAADRAVKALQVAVHNEDQVVEALTRGEGDGSERFGFIHFAVAHERPNLATGSALQAAVFEVLDEARVIDRLDRAESHGDGGEFPEVFHQPGVRIRREAAAGLQLAPEIFQFLLGHAAFEEGSRIDTGSGVSLEVDDIAIAVFRLCAKKVIEG